MYKECGKIVATHGIKGALRIKNFSDFKRFYVGNRLYIKNQNQYVPYDIERVSDYKNDQYLVTFKSLNDINLVLDFVGKSIYAISDKKDLEEDEYFYEDLIGKNVYNQEGILRGVVKDVTKMPQADMLVLEIEGKRKLVPMLKNFVLEISDKIVINEIEGLL